MLCTKFAESKLVIDSKTADLKTSIPPCQSLAFTLSISFLWQNTAGRLSSTFSVQAFWTSLVSRVILGSVVDPREGRDNFVFVEKPRKFSVCLQTDRHTMDELEVTGNLVRAGNPGRTDGER